MKRVFVVLTAALLGVLAGRSMHSSRRSASEPVVAATHEAPSFAAGSKDNRALAAALEPLLRRVAALPASAAPTEREARILATVREPNDAIELRHETQLADLRQRGISLRRDAVDHYLRVTDWMVQKGRLDRARFLLGQLTEPEYLDARTATTNEAFGAYQQGLSSDDFRQLFQWRSDKGPFDAEGSLAKPWSLSAPETSSSVPPNKDPSVPPITG